MHVLLVEDDSPLAESIATAMRAQGWRPDISERGEPVAASLLKDAYDALVLDIGLPGIDGLETLRRLREQGSSLPVLMLTARDAVTDRVRGLECGADDYLVKPFALKELKARLRALLRRAEAPEEEDGSLLRYADLTLDRGAWEAKRGTRKLELSRTEFQLLALFLEHPKQVLTRSQIFERVWGYDFGSSSNSLGVYMGYLRRKTEEGGEPRLLHTVRGVGYVLRD